MENKEQSKNELGNIYGSRVSKNGNWLNLLIITTHNGEKIKITCPVRIAYDENKPHANVDGNHAIIENIPVYEDASPSKREDTGDELPF